MSVIADVNGYDGFWFSGPGTIGDIILRANPLARELVDDAKHSLGHHGALLGVGDDV